MKYILLECRFIASIPAYISLVTGVPTGVMYAPPIANLTLFWFEYDDMNKLLNSDTGSTI